MGDSSLREDGIDMLRMSNMMGTERDIDMMGMDQQRYSNIMMGRNMMGQDSMGRNIYNIMSNRGMAADVMGHQMESNMMGQRKTLDVMGPNLMYSNMMGQDMTDNQMSSNMMDSNNRLMGQRMMQQMERIPETYTSTRMF